LKVPSTLRKLVASQASFIARYKTVEDLFWHRLDPARTISGLFAIQLGKQKEPIFGQSTDRVPPQIAKLL